MKKQKVIKVGNSLAITLPAPFVRDGNINAGDELYIEHNADHKTLYVRPEKGQVGDGLTPEFFEWLDEISEEYEDTIKALAKV